MKRIFIDGLSGMAQGLFATLIIGTIIQQIGLFVGGDYGNLIYMIGKVAAGLTGAGIGVGVAFREVFLQYGLSLYAHGDAIRVLTVWEC